MALIIVITLYNYTLQRVLHCYLPQYPHVCLLRVSASLLENQLNKEAIV